MADLALIIAAGSTAFCAGFVTCGVFVIGARHDDSELVLTEQYMVDRLRMLEEELQHVPARGADGRFVRRVA